MRSNDIISFSNQNFKFGHLNHKKDKFKLVSCPVNKAHCTDILSEINEFYAESECARINKEYQKSVELLQKAYYKTLELNGSQCSSCVKLFHKNINQTLEMMQEELHDMSFGLFRKKHYQMVHARLNEFLKNLNFFKIKKTRILTTKNISG